LRHRFLFLLPVAFVAAGCPSGGFSKRSQEARTGSFTYALNVSPTTLDPGMVQDIDTADLLNGVYEGLVGYDTENRIVGLVAERWEVSEDGRTYTFHIRPNAKFHNGRAVTAEDVKWSLERNLAKAFNSPTAINYLSDIVGAKELNEGKATEASGIKVVDPQTVTITIDQPRPYFLGKLTYACAYILPKEVGGTQIDGVAKSIGTGPFRLAEYRPDQAVTLEAFVDYYGGAAKIGKINRPIVQDAATRLNKYRAGDLDMLTIQRQEIPAIQADAKLKAELTYQPRPSVFYVGLSQLAYPPFKDVRVRQAIAYAVDRKRITQELLGGVPEARGLIAHNVIGYREDFAGTKYDPARSKRLLAEAGFPGGKGLPPLRIVYKAQTPDSQVIAEAIATSLRQATGWRVQPTALEWTSMLQARNKRQLEAYILSWYGDYLDPQNFLSFLFHSESPQNRDGYRNPEFDQLTEQADSEVDEKRRMELYQQAEDLLIQDAARIPIYYGRDAILKSPRVSGLRYNLFGNLPHTTVTVE
jgi:oligopeptide transport system substrate-binding protein